MRAVVLGGTGAIGEQLVGQLLVNGAWTEVITLGRRPVEVPAEYKGQEKAQLTQKVINMDNMATEAAQVFQGTDQVFCALGTTRKIAGDAATFKKVDYEYVATSAQLAKAAGVKHYSIVTAMGANANVWANDMKIFHGLLYTRTKGRAEEVVKQQGFDRVSIMRPGLLARGDKDNSLQKTLGKIIPSIPVRDVAKCMVLDALRSDVKPVMLFTDSAMVAAAKANQAPKA